MAAPALPRPTREARPDELMELLGSIRRELARRGESLAPAWVDQAVNDLGNGGLTGWYFSTVLPGAGLAFFSLRKSRAYGHIHIESGPLAVDRAVALAQRLIQDLPSGVGRMDAGITGLTPEEETQLTPRLSALPGGSVILRSALDRPITRADALEPTLPAGIRRMPVSSVPAESLQALDLAAFAGTPDATLLADTPEENRRVIQEVLDGKLGRFLGDASTILVSDEDHLVGALLTAEESPRRAIFLDLMVAPSHHHQGLGTYLLRWGFRALLALGYGTATLWVSEANTTAKALYDREGFRPRLSALLFRYAPGESPGLEPQPHATR